jgi:RNA 3'-terminal phosphate cyclase-like protein
LIGGTLEHDCSLQRSIGYFLEPLVLLAPFAKKPIKITLRGNTNGSSDPSVDYYRVCVFPLLKKFLPDNNLSIKIISRGVYPGGGGEVVFSCPVVRRMKPVQMMDCGKVRRIRGVAYCARVSPSMANRMVDLARSVLNQYLPDVYIYTDVARGGGKDRSPGYGITLVSESTAGVLHSAELFSHSPLSQGVEQGAGQPQPPALPEDIGKQTALLLIQEIVKGGYVDSGSQVVVLLFMALGQRDVSKVQLGELTPYTYVIESTSYT